jgi:hypothetical protein
MLKVRFARVQHALRREPNFPATSDYTHPLRFNGRFFKYGLHLHEGRVYVQLYDGVVYSFPQPGPHCNTVTLFDTDDANS